MQRTSTTPPWKTLSPSFLLSKYLFKSQTKNLPSSSLGYPLIGETLSFLRAQKEDRGWDWLEEMFKTSLMGSPTVVIIGQAGNKFVLGAEEDVFAAKQPVTSKAFSESKIYWNSLVPGARFLSSTNLMDLFSFVTQGALVTFLKPESLQNYINEMDSLAKTLILRETKEKDTIKAVARSSIAKLILPILRKKREELSSGILSPTSDVISCMLALRDENPQPIDDDVIIDNCITLVIASHDTSTILLSLMIRQLARDPEIYKKVLEDKLTWAEIQKMKYTWRVAQELMRTIPLVFGGFRKALKDTSYGVFWSSDGTHMNNDIFENSKVFDPSRFGNPSKPIPPYAYMTFGGGVHTCLGNEFAKAETLTTIHNLVTMYEWSQLNPEEVITRQPMPYPSMHLPIKIKPRHLF
ncbi:taxadiene 5-alpha hydroxylase [Quercus suber]|uniref:Taxadiene 5-alpha hydroxylase n=1 Tax=Quercus suber TaxID=58331 RepID=A0AAW0LPN0_QUESU